MKKLPARERAGAKRR